MTVNSGIAGPAITFNGTLTKPEALLIDNGAPANTAIGLSVAGTGGQNRSSPQSVFDRYAWGQIYATGDVTVGQSGGNAIFTGFIYTSGQITFKSWSPIQGGVFATSVNILDTVSALGTVNFCPGQHAALPLSPQFFNFTTLSWQDVPLNQP